MKKLFIQVSFKPDKVGHTASKICNDRRWSIITLLMLFSLFMDNISSMFKHDNSSQILPLQASLSSLFVNVYSCLFFQRYLLWPPVSCVNSRLQHKLELSSRRTVNSSPKTLNSVEVFFNFNSVIFLTISGLKDNIECKSLRFIVLTGKKKQRTHIKLQSQAIAKHQRKTIQCNHFSVQKCSTKMCS